MGHPPAFPKTPACAISPAHDPHPHLFRCGEAARIIDSGPDGQSDNGTDPGHRHQPTAHRVILGQLADTPCRPTAPSPASLKTVPRTVFLNALHPSRPSEPTAAPTNAPSPSSTAMTTSSTPAARPGSSSPMTPKPSLPSPHALGHKSVERAVGINPRQPHRPQTGQGGCRARTNWLTRYRLAWRERPHRPGQYLPADLAAPLPGAEPRRERLGYLRKNQLANRLYEDYRHIVVACCHALNAFVADPALVTSVPNEPGHPCHDLWRLG